MKPNLLSFCHVCAIVWRFLHAWPSALHITEDRTHTFINDESRWELLQVFDGFLAKLSGSLWETDMTFGLPVPAWWAPCALWLITMSRSPIFFLTVLLCFAVSEFSRKSRYITYIKSPILLDKVSILVYTSSVNAGEEWKHLQASLQENMVLQRFCANVMRRIMSVKGSNLMTHLPHTPHWIRIISNFILQKFFGIWWVILDCCQNCLNCPLLVLDVVGLFSATDPTKLQKPS